MAEFLAGVPLVAGEPGFTAEGEDVAAEVVAGVADDHPEAVELGGGEEAGVVGEVGGILIDGFDAPFAAPIHPAPFAAGGVGDGQAPALEGAAVLELTQGVGGILGGEEDGGADDVAVAVDVGPAAFLLHLGVLIVVVLAKGALVLIEGLYGPTAEVVDKAPEVGLGVGDGHAPGVVVACDSPLCASLFGLLGAVEDIVDDQHAATIDAAPAAFLLDRGVALGVFAHVGIGSLIDRLVFPATVVVDEAPAAVGLVAGGVDPFAGLTHHLPFVTRLASHLLGGEEVAADEVAVDVDAAPMAVEFHRRPFAHAALEFAGTLILRHDAPTAVGVLIAETLHGTLVDGLLRRGSEGRQYCEYEQYSKLFHCLIMYYLKCKDTKLCRYGQKKIHVPPSTTC